jgi:hypothetical protein
MPVKTFYVVAYNDNNQPVKWFHVNYLQKDGSWSPRMNRNVQVFSKAAAKAKAKALKTEIVERGWGDDCAAVLVTTKGKDDIVMKFEP